jgi:hypothetical protein
VQKYKFLEFFLEIFQGWRLYVLVLMSRAYLMIYRGPGFLAFVWFGSSPIPSPLPAAICLSVAVRAYWREKGGWGWWSSQIVRRRESLALLKSFNTLCSLVQTVVAGPCDDSVGEIRLPVFTMLWMKWTETQYACLSLLVAICLFKEVSHNRSRHACDIFQSRVKCRYRTDDFATAESQNDVA